MSDHEPTDTPRRAAGRTTRIAAMGIGVLSLVVVGALVARSMKPVRANLPAAEEVSTTATGTSPGTAPRAALVGKGSPVTVAGTSPITGKRTTLAALTGKPVVLTIWASWCPGCNEEAPHLSKVAAARTDVHFFGIDYRDNADDAGDFTTKYGWSMPTVEDPFGTIATGLGLQGTPTTIFLDANHREVGRVVGAMDQDGLEDAIDQLVGA
jgi:thiol-disulfide isomerase/thioredoxin